MKTIKQFSLLILCVLVTTHALSLEKKRVRVDTVRIKFDTALLEVSTFDLKSNTLEKAGIQDKINELLRSIENIEIVKPAEGERICIMYSGVSGGKEHDFKKLKLKTSEIENKTIVVKDEVFLETDYGNILLEVEDESYFIRLYLNQIEDAQLVNTSEFISKIKEADKVIPENRKKTNIWLVETDSNSFNTYQLGETPPYTLDVLELNAGITTGLVKNEFVSGFNLRVGVSFSKKGIQKSRYFVDYEFVYDFSDHPENKSFSTNDFLSLGVERNFSMDPGQAKWYGFSVGYLVNRNNDFFNKNTFKLSLQKHFNNSISLKPEVYFNDFFKNVSPGLKLQVTF